MNSKKWVADNLEQLRCLSPIRSGEAYQMYCDWCDSKGLEKNTHSDFGCDMKSIGVPKRKSSHIFYEFKDITTPSVNDRYVVLINKNDWPHVEVWVHGCGKPVWTSKHLSTPDGVQGAADFMMGGK
jgi:hypothetical protein